MTWHEVPEAEPERLGFAGWLRAVLRGLPLAVLVLSGLAILLLIRLIERPICGLHRPVTPLITQFVCRSAFRILGVGYSVKGEPMHHPGAVVANHTSWLDIFALNASQPVYFIAKSEVSGWPLIGWLARATGTLFIRRDRRDAVQQRALIEARLDAGHKLLFFPEGTSSDGVRVLPFKSTLFAAFFADHMSDISYIQPATLTYHAPKSQVAWFYGWWGDMELAPHLLQTLGAKRQGRVELVLAPPLKVSEFADRKTLAQVSEDIVRENLNLTAPSGT